MAPTHVNAFMLSTGSLYVCDSNAFLGEKITISCIKIRHLKKYKKKVLVDDEDLSDKKGSFSNGYNPESLGEEGPDKKKRHSLIYLPLSS